MFSKWRPSKRKSPSRAPIHRYPAGPLRQRQDDRRAPSSTVQVVCLYCEMVRAGSSAEASPPASSATHTHIVASNASAAARHPLVRRAPVRRAGRCALPPEAGAGRVRDGQGASQIARPLNENRRRRGRPEAPPAACASLDLQCDSDPVPAFSPSHDGPAALLSPVRCCEARAIRRLAVRRLHGRSGRDAPRIAPRRRAGLQPAAPKGWLAHSPFEGYALRSALDS